MKFIIKWPTKDVLQHNLPQVFKETYPNTVCIIDCSEIFIDRPMSFEPRAKTYSQYKKHDMAKFLIAITPCGTICYVSRCWGGRVSDRYLTQKCGFLEKLQPGDLVLADRGFNIEEDLNFYGARLAIPAFTRGKRQLSLLKWNYLNISPEFAFMWNVSLGYSNKSTVFWKDPYH